MKPKFFCLIVLLWCFNNGNGQTVIINDYQGLRPLTWEDFKGKPDPSSPFDAVTHWNIKYHFTSKTIGDSVQAMPEVTLVLGDLSWVRPNKKNEELLKHEQGHFTIGYLCARELTNKLQVNLFPKQDFLEYMKRAFGEVMQKYKDMEKKYDDETDHSKNKEQQKKWDDFFKTSSI